MHLSSFANWKVKKEIIFLVKILKKGSNTELGRAPTMFSACYHLINDFMAIMSEIILGIKTPLFSPGTEHKVRCWFPLHILAES